MQIDEGFRDTKSTHYGLNIARESSDTNRASSELIANRRARHLFCALARGPQPKRLCALQLIVAVSSKELPIQYHLTILTIKSLD